MPLAPYNTAATPVLHGVQTWGFPSAPCANIPAYSCRCPAALLPLTPETKALGPVEAPAWLQATSAPAGSHAASAAATLADSQRPAPLHAATSSHTRCTRVSRVAWTLMLPRPDVQRSRTCSVAPAPSCLPLGCPRELGWLGIQSTGGRGASDTALHVALQQGRDLGVTPSPWQAYVTTCLQSYIQWARQIYNVEVQSLQTFNPACLTLAKERLRPKVDQRLVISVNCAFVAVQVRPELHARRKQRQQLLITGTIVTFSRQVLVGVVTYRVVPIWILLQQYSTNCVITSVTLHHKVT